ncbi:hypothetical protein [Ramlibacter algicola]|uniref:Histidine kinase n=1 Tax=Ramlibacter algicola TaxID=2795217 RepID=A0A934PZA7_9BURK|nr:hypothetical protein [Ramlibacter algicola]MBK0391437.1 hypothetical protein [Ramlibacter algicola]
MNEATSSISAAEANLLRVEAARYALLRRLAYAIRHQLVMHLQPIGMVNEVLDRRLRVPQPDLAQVREGVGKINTLSKTAVNACLDVITWLAPEAGATVPAEAGVQEIMELLRSNFSFRGFALLSEVQALPQPVNKGAVRLVLPGVLLALSDTMDAPAQIVISGRTGEDVVQLQVRVSPQPGEAPPAPQLPYRGLQWADVLAMARSEDVDLERTDTSATLTFPVLE